MKVNAWNVFFHMCSDKVFYLDSIVFEENSASKYQFSSWWWATLTIAAINRLFSCGYDVPRQNVIEQPFCKKQIACRDSWSPDWKASRLSLNKTAVTREEAEEKEAIQNGETTRRKSPLVLFLLHSLIGCVSSNRCLPHFNFKHEWRMCGKHTTILSTFSTILNIYIIL